MTRKRNKNKAQSTTGPINLGLKSDVLVVDVSPIYGRFLKTKVDVKRGDIILKEKYLIAGPKINSRGVCIGCHSDLKDSSKTYSCTKCKWFFCSPKCSTSSPFHTHVECKFLEENHIEPPRDLTSRIFGCITILRCLLLKYKTPINDWQKLMSLQSHAKERKIDPDIWQETQRCIKIICEDWKLKPIFTQEEIEAVCGIYEVNSFEMGDCYSFGGIFPISSMCAHDCIPNCSQNENIDELSLEIFAMVDIPAGSPIKLCYDSCLKGTRPRQEQLKRSKYFDCSCKRCSDPTELGTHFSTLMCSKCKKGFMTNHTEDGVWKCNKCSASMSYEAVDELIEKYTTLASSNIDIKSQERILVECKPLFHPNHFIPFGIKFSLCMAYGREEGFLIEELSNSSGHRKLELCQEVMKVLNVLTPGLSISRGNILYEQQAAEVLIAKNLLDGGRCSKALVKHRLKYSVELLEEAIFIFELNYATKILAESAKNTTLKELQSWISTLK